MPEIDTKSGIAIGAVIAIVLGILSQTIQAKQEQVIIQNGIPEVKTENTNLPCTYMIYKTSVYNSENCNTGNIDYSSSNASSVLLNTISVLPNQDGIIYIKNNITLNNVITISKNVSISFDRTGSYYNPNVIWNGSSGNYVFDFKGGNFQTVNLRGMYIDGQNKTGGTGGIHFDGHVSRAYLDNIGVKRTNGEGIVMDGFSIISGTHVEVYQSCSYGFDATGLSGLTTFDLISVTTIGNGNCAVGGKTFTVHFKNVQGTIVDLVASGATTSAFGGPSLKGIYFETAVNNLFIGTLHVEATTGVGGTSTIYFGGSVGHVGDVKATTIQNIFLYNYNGTANPIQLLSTQNLFIGAIQAGCPTAVSYSYNVEATYSASFPNNNINSTIATIANTCAKPILDLWKNIKVLTPGNPYIIYDQKTNQLSGTGALTLISYTPPPRIATYQICISIDVSAENTGTLGWTASWTDSNGNSRTPTNLALFQDGTAVPALTFISSAIGNYNACDNIDVNNGSGVITVKTTFTGTSIAYKASAWITRIQ